MWGDVVWSAGLLTGGALIGRVPALAAGAPASPPGGAVLVVIPARDEADRIGLLLDDLATQTAPPARVVVVNDDSQDATAQVAGARAGVEVRDAGPTPAGWNPKTWALSRGLAGATEAELVVLDADVRLAPGALAALARARRHHDGLVTVAPRHDVERPWEVLSLPCNLVAVMGAGGGRGVFGPCVAMARATLDGLGGYGAVRADLVDDLALGRLARSHDVPVAVLRGDGLIRYRMYRHGPAELVEGWTKNLAVGAGSLPLSRRLAVAAWVTASLTPLLALGGLPAPADLARWLVVGGVLVVLGRRVARVPWWALLVAPLLVAFFVLLVARSAERRLRRRPVRWKGRWHPAPLGRRGRADAAR